MTNVLLVEDDIDLASTIVDYLELETIQCDHASNGLLGLNLIERQPYQVIILDINMPGISGFYIANNLKNSEACPHKAPIILVSSEPYTEEIKEKCVESDVDGYVQKPMTEALLATILDEYVPNKEISLLATGAENSKLFLRKRQS